MIGAVELKKLFFKKEQKMARKSSVFWQRMGKTIAVLAVMTMTVTLFAQQGSAQLVWQNTSNNRTNYWVLNSNGSLKNRTQGDGWDNIATFQPAAGFYIQTIQANGGRNNLNHIIWQNTTNGKVTYWATDTTGVLKNRTQGDGWDNISTFTVSTAWRIYDINYNVGGTEIDHLAWINGSTRKPVYWVLNSNGTLKNRTQGDGWQNVDKNGEVNLGVGWYAGGIQRNADSLGNPHIIWQNTSNGKTAYWKLNSNGTLKNKTQDDGWGLISDFTLNSAWRLLTVQPNADKLGTNHMIWQNTSNRKAVYWNLTSAGVIKNRTQGDGWDNIATFQPAAGWTMSSVLRNGDTQGNDHLLWLNTTNGKSLFWKLNSNGTLKNRTQGDGWDYINTFTNATGWRIRGAHNPADATVN
jgi:hypothetical protein